MYKKQSIQFFTIAASIIFIIVMIVLNQNFFSSEKQLVYTNDTVRQMSSSEELMYWQNFIQDKGGFEAYDHFGEIYDESTYGVQHTHAHVFGEALYKTLGTDGIVVCNSSYGFGCYHSFFGWALNTEGVGMINKLDAACIETYGERGLGCQHGLGHGVLAELGYGDIDGSLELCKTLNWQEPIGGCTSGVFMEFNFNTIAEGVLREVPDDDYHYPCNAIGEDFREACYFDQPQWWFAITNDYSQVGEFCSEVDVLKDQTACYRGVGNMVAGIREYDVEGMLDACSMMPDNEGRLLCIEGATWLMSAQPEFEGVWEQMCAELTEDAFSRCISSKDFI